MIPRLGEKFEVNVETISKAREQYSSAEYLAQKLPKAPAIMIGDEVVIEGAVVSQEMLESAICRHLGLPEPAIID